MIICITGPMAAGKNYISSKYEEDGWISIDADKLVHSAINECAEKILSKFSSEAEKRNIELKNEDGTLNRRALGKLLFADKKLLAKQEEIVYPVIIEKTEKIIAENSGKNIILNATLLFKTPKLLNHCEKILFVTAPLLTRFIRAKKRDNLPAAQILKRFWLQRNLLKEYKKTGVGVEIVKNNRL